MTPVITKEALKGLGAPDLVYVRQSVRPMCWPMSGRMRPSASRSIRTRPCMPSTVPTVSAWLS